MSFQRGFLSIKQKFVLLAILILAALLLPRMIAFQLVDNVKIGSSLYKDIERERAASRILSDIKIDLQYIRAESYNLLLNSESGYESIKNLIEEADERIARNFQLIQKMETDKKISESLSALHEEFEKLDNILDEKLYSMILKRGNHADITNLLSEQESIFISLGTRIDQISRDISTEVAVFEKRVNAIISDRISQGALVSGFGMLVILLLVFTVARSILRTISNTITIVDCISEGNFKSEVTLSGTGELGALSEALERMKTRLSLMISDVINTVMDISSVSSNLNITAIRLVDLNGRQAEVISTTTDSVSRINDSIVNVYNGMDILNSTAEETASSIAEISASIDTVAETVELLTDSVEEVSSSIVEMSASLKQVSSSVASLVDVSSITTSSIYEMDSSIKEVLENSSETARITSDVLKDAEVGRTAVQAAMIGMKEIHSASVITSDVIDKLSAKVENIGSIISVIDEITEQTSLLALNAAIIASQAGEHGKGFAVVADEVRELAERTASSTNEISLVIKGVQEESKRAVEAILMSNRSIAEGEHLSTQSGLALDKIVNGIKDANQRISRIATSIDEQGKGSNAIRNAATEFASMVEQIATATNEQAKFSDLIINASEKMRTMMQQVRVAIQDQSAFGKVISESTLRVVSLVDSVRNESKKQQEISVLIQSSMKELESVSFSTSEVASTVNSSVEQLVKNAETLSSQTNNFRLA